MKEKGNLLVCWPQTISQYISVCLGQDKPGSVPLIC